MEVKQRLLTHVGHAQVDKGRGSLLFRLQARFITVALVNAHENFFIFEARHEALRPAHLVRRVS